MSETEQIKTLQDELDRKDRMILDMRLALIDSRLAQLDDHELRLRAVEQKTVESRTILTLAFGTGLLSLGNLITMWVK